MAANARLEKAYSSCRCISGRPFDIAQSDGLDLQKQRIRRILKNPLCPHPFSTFIASTEVLVVFKGWFSDERIIDLEDVFDRFLIAEYIQDTYKHGQAGNSFWTSMFSLWK